MGFPVDELVTASDLEGKFAALLDAVESLGSRLGVRGGAEYREYMTRKEAADYLRLSVSKLDQLAAHGKIVRCKIGGGSSASVLFRRRELDKFVEAHTI